MLGDLGKLIGAKGFKKLPKLQKLPDLVTLEAAKQSMSIPIQKIRLAGKSD